MSYILHKDKPYYFNGKNAFPCSISADKVKVDFNHPIKEKVNINCIYTESEIKHRLGIFMIDGWDSKKKKVIKVSNQTISSIPAKSNS